MKKYPKVVRHGKTDVHQPGDTVVIWEKLDGSNASFKWERTPVALKWHQKLRNKLNIGMQFADSRVDFKAFSRNRELDSGNTLNGFYNWANEHPELELLPEGLTLYGEWLVPHTVKYKEEYYKKFYLFSVFDENIDQWLPLPEIVALAETFNLTLAPILAVIEYTNTEALKPYVGQSEMTVEPNTGEGAVITNQTEGRVDTSTKYVSDAFLETKQIKYDRKDLPETAIWVKANATPARIDKIIFKLRDENELGEVNFQNFGRLAKMVSIAVYDDILEEERDTRPAGFDENLARRTVNKVVPLRIRDFIEKTEDSKN